MQPTKQAAQCQLLLIVLVIILTLFSYCLISLSKPQPDLHHGGQVKSNSDRIYTNDFFQGATVMLAFRLLLSNKGEKRKKNLLNIHNMKLIF